MKTVNTSVLGFDVPVSGVPETLDEAIKAAGSESALVEKFNDYVRFHRTNSEVRSAIVEALETITGIKVETEEVKSPTKADPNRTVEKRTESDQTYADRAIASSGKNRAELTPDVLSAVGTIEFKAIGEPRVGGPGKLAKVYTEAAQKLIDAGPDKLANAVGLLQQANPGITIATDANGQATVESLAAALKANRQRVEREADAALGLVA